MINKTLLIGVAGFMLPAAIPAAAVVKIAKYTGTVSTGYDETGVFGAANTNLAGVSYVTTYTYDKTLGIQSGSVGTYDHSHGGVEFGFPGQSPLIGATISINGVTLDFFTANQGWITTSAVNGSNHTTTYLYDDGVYRTY